MIEPIDAAKQIERLAGLDFYPHSSPMAQKELRLAIENCDSVAEADTIIGEFVHHGRECPKPADLRRLIHERHGERVRDCEKCGGAGYTEQWRLRWRDTRSDGTMRMVERVVSDEREGWYQADAMAAHKEPTVYRVAVDCGCRPKPTASEPTRKKGDLRKVGA